MKSGSNGNFKLASLRVQSPRRILLPRFDTLGDIIILEGFISILIEEFPDTSISLLVREGYDQLATLFPSQIRWLTTSIKPYRQPEPCEYLEIRSFVSGLKAEDFDLIICTTYNRTWLDYAIATSLPDARRIALGKREDFPDWLVRVLDNKIVEPCFDAITQVAEGSSEEEKYRQLWAAVCSSKSVKLPLPKVIVPPPYQIAAEAILKQMDLHAGKFYICTVTCTQELPFKSWPRERFSKVANWLFDSHGLTPLLVGHESEKVVVDEAEQLMTNAGVKSYKWLGKPGELALLAGIVGNARFYLGNDTGPMHIAAALGIPTVGIFGGGHWPRFLPIGEKAVGVAAELPCFGCNWSDCIFGDAPCVKLVPVKDVKNAIKKVLSNITVNSNFYPTSQVDKAKFKELYDVCLESKLNELKRLEDCNNQLVCKLTQFHASLSWRITKPLRWLGDLVRKL